MSYVKSKKVLLFLFNLVLSIIPLWIIFARKNLGRPSEFFQNGRYRPTATKNRISKTNTK